MDAKRVLWISSNQSRTPAECPSPPADWTIDSRSPDGALEELSQHRYDALVLDFPASDWTTIDLLECVRRFDPQVPLLIRDFEAPLSDAQVARFGAYQSLAPADDVFVQIDLAIEARRAASLATLAVGAGREEWERMLVGESPEMRQVSHIIRLVGARRSTVLITGETGTGKEVAARALHLASPRRRAPWVAVNCSALPENLLEAELFGHVRGAFTGALQNRVGRFEQAHRGTLFLDEIGDLPMDLQAKLLRVLQEREFQRLGSSETIHVDIRVVAATNCDLLQRVEEGRFREDLYYRLNVVPIHMPPLRQRPGDIPMLALHFLEKVCRIEEIRLKSLRPEAIERLRGHAWPGNVRQLENAVEMAVALSGERTMLVQADFPLAAPARARATLPVNTPVVSVPDDGLDYEQTLAIIERSILEQALRKTGGNKKAAAGMLRLKRTTLAAKMRSLDSADCN
jgi:DNA-binding NtrC family response regulator